MAFLSTFNCIHPRHSSCQPMYYEVAFPRYLRDTEVREPVTNFPNSVQVLFQTFALGNLRTQCLIDHYLGVCLYLNLNCPQSLLWKALLLVLHIQLFVGGLKCEFCHLMIFQPCHWLCGCLFPHWHGKKNRQGRFNKVSQLGRLPLPEESQWTQWQSLPRLTPLLRLLVDSWCRTHWARSANWLVFLNCSTRLPKHSLLSATTKANTSISIYGYLVLHRVVHSLCNTLAFG